MATVAREIEVVQGPEARDARFPCRTEALVSAIHVAEMGFAAALRHHFAVDDRRLPGDPLPGSVGMPSERALVGMMPAGPALPVEVGEAVELGIAVGVVLVHHVDLQLAEAAGELDLTARRQV